ncbi:proline-rich protein PRCC [Periplaneta americana]|uniref:proline-rich protein PRCC n=1 Tax=Periplaneta americana TaxID=6978 RepID=UPI0037E875E5
MSALVDYGSSDESENEIENENEENTKPITEPVIEPESPVLIQITKRNEDKLQSEGLFSALPPPRTSTNTFTLDTEDRLNVSDSKLLQKKQPVKIIIPSLSEFKDEEESEPAKKKLKPSMKGSGLFSLLPAPKNLSLKETKRSFVPHILSKKPTKDISASHTPSTPILKSETTNTIKKSSSLISYADSEEESDGEGDFFSLKADNKVELLNDTDTSVSNSVLVPNIDTDNRSPSKENAMKTNDEPLAFNSKFNPSPWSSGPFKNVQVAQESWQDDTKPSSSQSVCENNDDYISIRQEDLQLNEEALQRLCGRRAKRQQQEMQLIEVSGDAIMPDPNEWLTKQLTQEQETKIHSHSHRKNDGPTTQQRRKHQITYLAFQAKENELELKNQWSQNRMSRKQTQSKYGF